jgi:hypothetical protein
MLWWLPGSTGPTRRFWGKPQSRGGRAPQLPLSSVSKPGLHRHSPPFSSLCWSIGQAGRGRDRRVEGWPKMQPYASGSGVALRLPVDPPLPPLCRGRLPAVRRLPAPPPWAARPHRAAPHCQGVTGATSARPRGAGTNGGRERCSPHAPIIESQMKPDVHTHSSWAICLWAPTHSAAGGGMRGGHGRAPALIKSTQPGMDSPPPPRDPAF